MLKKKGLVCYKATCQHGRSNNTQPETRTASKLQCSHIKWFCMYKCYSTYKSVFSSSAAVFICFLFMWQESEGGRTHPRAHHPEHKRRKKHQPRAKHLHFKCYSLSRFVFKQQSGLEKTQFCTLQLIYQTHTQDQKLAPEFVAGLIVCLHTQSHPKGPF